MYNQQLANRIANPSW